MFCQKCGTERVGENAFCANCGNSFSAPFVAESSQNTNTNPADLFKRLINVVVKLIKKPATTATEFARQGDTKLSIMLLTAQSAAGFIAVLFFLFTILISDGGYILEYIGGTVVALMIAAIVTPFIGKIIAAAFFLLYSNVITKEKKSFSNMLAVSAIISVPTTIACLASTVIGFLFSLFAPSIGAFLIILIISASTIASYFLAGAGLKGAGNGDDDKRFFTLIASFCTTIVLTIISVSTMIPVIAKLGAGSFMSGLFL